MRVYRNVTGFWVGVALVAILALAMDRADASYEVYAYVCTPAAANERTVALTTDVYGTCNGAGNGYWKAITVLEEVDVQGPPPFDPLSLDPTELAAAFGAGFVTLGTGLLLVFGARIVIRSIRDGW